MPEGAVYVGRGSKWGNPFVVGKDGTAADCLWLYKLLAAGMLCISKDLDHIEAQEAAHSAMLTARAELAGKDLACWCRIDRPCHADVLLALANGVPVDYGDVRLQRVN